MDFRKLIDPVLGSPALYELSQRMLGAKRSHTVFMRDYVCPTATEAVLDIGCGVGSSLSHLTAENRYLGIDIDGGYIARARKKYGHRAIFLRTDVADLDLSAQPPFSCAFAYGVLHHLDDLRANRMFAMVAKHVTDRFVTIDPVVRPNEHPVARYLISQDRGRSVRTAEGYYSIAREYGSVQTQILTNLLRVPYAHIVMRISLRSGEGGAVSAIPQNEQRYS